MGRDNHENASMSEKVLIIAPTSKNSNWEEHTMSYINAETVLPKEIIEAIQKYVDGKPLYIPRKNNNRKSWGEISGTRKTLKKRNGEIYLKFLQGVSITELSTMYYLSDKSVQRIIRQEKLSNDKPQIST